MQTAHNARPKHGPHISISDDNHHVTDAISSLYDYSEQQAANPASRPLSFMPSAREEIHLGRLNQQPRSPTSPLNPSLFNPASDARPTPDRRQSRNGTSNLSSVVGAQNSRASPQSSDPGSPNSLQSPQDAAESLFPINNIDYESSPAAVQQELSNLAAIRRMSMNVDVAGDPDLPSFTAGTPNSVDEDPNRLFWVPARLHPELAPKEFKSFLDSKTEAIKRRSGDFTASDELGRSVSGGSGGGLRRSKSKLSKQIDNTGGRGADGYEDGSGILDRKRSGSSRLSVSTTPGNSLAAMEALMEDPEKVLGRLSLEAAQKENSGDEDIPILSGPGSGLKRSTRTTYRKGSLRRGERVPGSGRRIRTSEQSDQTPPPIPQDLNIGVSRSATDPGRSASNFSRPRAQSPPTSAGAVPGTSFDSILQAGAPSNSYSEPLSPPDPRDGYEARYSAPVQASQNVPDIEVSETPQPEQSWLGSQFRRSPSSSHDQQGVLGTGLPTSTSSSGRTDNLAAPLGEEKSSARKMVSKKRSNDGSKKSGWSLSNLLGSDEKKEEKEKRKREAAEKAAERAAEKAAAATDEEIIAERQARRGKATDNTRLDLLQQTMDSGSTRPRESLVLERNDVDLDEARKGQRKSSSNKPKEKDGGLLHSLFGGKKNKAERESHSGKSSRNSQRPESSNESSQRPALKPDVDYNWTRFSILEERAIYRMAHIKLANPRRELRSQVLLSNFMYSYLAKVQQMHPQIQIPQSAAQKAQQRQERERQRKEQPEEYYQYQRYQESLQAQDAASGASSNNGSYAEEQGYEYDDQGYSEHGSDAYGYDQRSSQGSQGSQGYHQGYTREQSPYQYQQGQFDDPSRRDDDDDMW